MGNLYALDYTDGSLAWKFNATGVAGHPAVGPDGTVYLPTWNGILHTVDPESGEEIWQYQIDNEEAWLKGAVVTTDGQAVVANVDNGTVVAISPRLGTEFWRTSLGIDEYATLIASDDNAVYGMTSFDSLVKFRPGGDTSVPPGFDCAPCGTGCLSPEQPATCSGDGAWESAGVSSCPSSESCVDGGSIVCETHAGSQCVDGDAFWIDSCGRQEEKKESCQSGQDCLFGECCKTQDHKGCEGDSIHWFDSCGRTEELVDECGSGKDCKDGTCVDEAPDYCSCTCYCSWCSTSTTCEGSGCGSCYSICVDTCSGNPDCGSYSSHTGSCS